MEQAEHAPAAEDVIEFINDTAVAIMAAASGRTAMNNHIKAVQPVITELWAAGGAKRNIILRIADKIAAELSDRKDLKNTALSILRVRASRAQKAAGDLEQGITLRSGTAQWQPPKAATVPDYIGEVIKLLSKAVEHGQLSEAHAQDVARLLLTKPVEEAIDNGDEAETMAEAA